MLSEQKCLREYFTACEIPGKELCLCGSFFFFFKGSNKQHSFSARHADTGRDSFQSSEVVDFKHSLFSGCGCGYQPQREAHTILSSAAIAPLGKHQNRIRLGI